MTVLFSQALAVGDGFKPCDGFHRCLRGARRPTRIEAHDILELGLGDLMLGEPIAMFDFNLMLWAFIEKTA